MTKEEAKIIAENYLNKYREKNYSELVKRIGEEDIFEGFTDNDEKYQIEAEINFDDEKTKKLRVTAMISYNLVTDFSPIVSGFIIAPNGKFIDE